MQDTAEGTREVRIGDGLRPGQVDGPADLAFQQVPDGADLVLDRDPAPPLTTGPEPATQPHSEQRKHLGQRAAVAEHQTRPYVRDPDARVLSRRSCRLPRDADLGEEVISGARVLPQELVAAVAVVTDGRTGDQHLWPLLHGGQGRCQPGGGRCAAVENPSLLLWRP